MLEQLKLLLSIPDDTQDDLISLLIEMAKDEAITFCHLDEYNEKLNNIVMKMVVQNFNKIGNEGFNSTSFGGVMQESYLTNYSDDILTTLKRYRKIVSV